MAIDNQDDQARKGTEAHSSTSNQDRRTTEPKAVEPPAAPSSYDRHQGHRMGSPVEYFDRYSQQGGRQPQGQDSADRSQAGLLGEKDLQPIPTGTSGASGEHARKPDSERDR